MVSFSGNRPEALAHGDVSTGELTHRLRNLPNDPADAYVVAALVDRAEQLNDAEKDGVIAALSALVGGTVWQPKQRVTVDHAIQRLLWLFNVESAFALAAECVTSRRANRRHAAYRFYLRHGLDDRARAILRERFDDDSARSGREDRMYRQTIATDPDLVA
ncbi:hypothetical protein [Nocardia xishanensis]